MGGSVRSLPPERLVNRIRARSNLFSVSFLVTSGPPYKPIIVTVFNLICPHHPQPPTSPPPVPVRRVTCPCAVSRAHAAVPRARPHSCHTLRQRHRQPARTPPPAPALLEPPSAALCPSLHKPHQHRPPPSQAPPQQHCHCTCPNHRARVLHPLGRRFTACVANFCRVGTLTLAESVVPCGSLLFFSDHRFVR